MAEQPWDPDQYRRFAAERRRPFTDLLAGLTPVPGGRVVDLGCGTGELTAELHERLQAASTVGIDSSPTMLERAPEGIPGLAFERGRLEEWRPPEPVDVIAASASLHWVPGHAELLPTLVEHLAPGGQLAFQVPANHDHPSHRLADELGAERGLAVRGGASTVLPPEDYATVLHHVGLNDVDVILRVYGFELAAADEVVEWTKGTLLTGYRSQLDEAGYADFEAEYRRRLTEALGGASPYYYAFKRILAWGRRPG
jgi:trans-aconitate 2-methyltransferase